MFSFASDCHGPKTKSLFLLADFWSFGVRQNRLGVWVKKFLENLPQMINRNVDQIIYCYGEYQPIFDEIRQNMPEIQFYEGFPDVKGITDPYFHTLMIIDDLQN